MLNRRLFLTSLTAALALLRSWRPSRAAQPLASTKLTLVLVNDIYLMGPTTFPDGRVRGGFARLAAVVKAERAKGGRVLVAHGGDTLSPSLMSGLDQGAHIVALLNMIGLDIFVPGNHEFDFGKAVFLQRMEEARFPLYGANMRDATGNALPRFLDRVVHDFDGVRIGITGLGYERSAALSSPEDLVFMSTLDVTKSQAAALRRDGADFVLAVAHADRGDAIALQFARAADMLLTGHTHDLFLSFDGLNGVVESGFDAHYVTAIDLDIRVIEREGQRSTAWWPRFRIIDTADVDPDPEVEAAVAAYEAQLSRELDVPLARTAVLLDSRNATMRGGEAAIGNLFADAARWGTRADAAVINGGGIRGNKVFEPGATITRRDVLAELPFNNRLIVLELTGAELKRALENGLVKPGGRFPQVSGLAFTADMNRPAGDRIVTMFVNSAPAEATRLYRVAVPDFLARGGDEYESFQHAQRITPDSDAPLLANAVMAYVREQGTIRTGIEGRIVLR